MAGQLDTKLQGGGGAGRSFPWLSHVSPWKAFLGSNLAEVAQCTCIILGGQAGARGFDPHYGFIWWPKALGGIPLGPLGGVKAGHLLSERVQNRHNLSQRGSLSLVRETDNPCAAYIGNREKMVGAKVSLLVPIRYFVPIRRKKKCFSEAGKNIESEKIQKRRRGFPCHVRRTGARVQVRQTWGMTLSKLRSEQWSDLYQPWHPIQAWVTSVVGSGAKKENKIGVWNKNDFQFSNFTKQNGGMMIL